MLDRYEPKLNSLAVFSVGPSTKFNGNPFSMFGDETCGLRDSLILCKEHKNIHMT